MHAAPPSTLDAPESPDAGSPSSALLWRRYWLFGWIFEDCNRGDVFANAAALRRNRSRAGLLPVYMLRYLVTCALSVTGTMALGNSAPPALQLLCVLPTIACVPLLVISLSIWLALHPLRN